MSDDPKAKRRALIAEAADERSKKASPRTYWLTRNRLEGVLSGRVDIWLARPDRIALPDGDVQWLALEEMPSSVGPNGEVVEESAHYGRWTVDRARLEVRGGVPDTDRECLKVGGEDVVPDAAEVS